MHAPAFFISRLVLVMATFGLIAASPQEAAEKAANENPAVVRWASGKFIYRVSEDLRQRGYEDWRLSVHADGSRTFTMWYSVFEDHLETSTILRVDENFRPLNLFKTTWVDDTMTTTHAIVDGNTVKTLVQVGDDVTEKTVEVPDIFTMMIGPIAADALHFGPYDKEKGGLQGSNILASVSAGGDKTDIGKATESRKENIGLSVVAPIKIELIGKETVTVAAGTFETDHYHMPGFSDMWLYGEDLTLVKYQWHLNGYEYELLEYASGP